MKILKVIYNSETEVIISDCLGMNAEGESYNTMYWVYYIGPAYRIFYMNLPTSIQVTFLALSHANRGILFLKMIAMLLGVEMHKILQKFLNFPVDAWGLDIGAGQKPINTDVHRIIFRG